MGLLMSQKTQDTSAVLVHLEDVHEQPVKVILDEVLKLIQDYPAAFGLRWQVMQGEYTTQRYLRSEYERGY